MTPAQLEDAFLWDVPRDRIPIPCFCGYRRQFATRTLTRGPNLNQAT